MNSPVDEGQAHLLLKKGIDTVTCGGYIVCECSQRGGDVDFDYTETCTEMVIPFDCTWRANGVGCFVVLCYLFNCVL